MKQPLKPCVCLLTLLSLTACASTISTPFSLVKESQHCQETTFNIAQLDNENTLSSVVRKLVPFHSEEDKQLLKNTLSKQSEIQNLFIIALGNKPTSGYSFKFTHDYGQIEQNTLFLPINVSQPNEASFQTQLITSPCIILGIDKKYVFKSIKINDFPSVHL